MKSFDKPPQKESSIFEKLPKIRISSRFMRIVYLGIATEIGAIGYIANTALERYLELKKDKAIMERIDPESYSKIDKECGDFFLKQFYDNEKNNNKAQNDFSIFSQIQNIPFNKQIPNTSKTLNENLEKEDLMDSAFLIKICTETFPKGWFNGEVSSIEYENNKGTMNPTYGIEDSGAWGDYSRDKRKIVFHNPTKLQSVISNINICLSHELGHANDWLSDNESFLDDKIKLLADVLSRLNSYDRYRSSYVEGIGISEEYKSKEDGKKLQKYNKAVEYWAEICSVYFSSPNILNYKDFKIVDDWVKKQDPSFKLDKSIHDRNEIINHWLAKKQVKNSNKYVKHKG